MSWLQNGLSYLGHGISHLGDNIAHAADGWFAKPNAQPTPEEPTAPHTEAPSPHEDTPSTSASSSVPQSAESPSPTGPAHQEIPPVDKKKSLMSHFDLLKTDYCNRAELRARTLAQQIDDVHNNMKEVDLFFSEFADQLNAHKSVDLSKGRFPALLENLKKLGLHPPATMKMDMEQATLFLKSVEHKREEFERSMKLLTNKFGEASKDIESLRKVLFEMLAELNKAVEKILGGIRG